MIERYILDKKEDLKSLEVFPREIEFPMTKQFIISAIGPRRAGKSYSLVDLIRKLNLKDEEYIFINFEEENVKSLSEKEIKSAIAKHMEIYGSEPKFIFLDEIQELKNWQTWVYTLYEKKRYHIFITGSSSKLLSREIATQLRGRAITIPVFPFSFKEFLKLNKVQVKKFLSSREESKVKNLLRRYIEIGGFPQIVLEEVNSKIFFRDYIDLVVFRDIVERYRVKESYLVKTFIKFVASSFSSEFSINKVFNTLKSQGIAVSKKTLYSYANYLEDAMFCFFLKKFDFSERKTELSIPKVYVNDPGLINYLLHSRITENIGKLIENIVFLELKKKEFSGKITRIFYYKDASEHEVDFVIKEGLDIKQLIQVTCVNDFSEMDKREWRNLIVVGRKLKCKNLLCITWNYENEIELEWKGTKRKVKFMPLWKWLLQWKNDLKVSK
jgi:hypothetical protein